MADREAKERLCFGGEKPTKSDWSGIWLSICPACDGTGTRDWLSGAPCLQCRNGFIESDDTAPDLPDCGNPETDNG